MWGSQTKGGYMAKLKKHTLLPYAHEQRRSGEVRWPDGGNSGEGSPQTKTWLKGHAIQGTDGILLTQVKHWAPGSRFTEIVLDESGNIVAYAQAKRESQAWAQIEAQLRHKGLI